MSAYRLLRMAAFFAATSFLLIALYLFSSTGGYDVTGHIIGRDFLNTHLGGELINADRSEVLFDGRAYWDEIKLQHGTDYPIHNWSYPPLLWPISQGLAQLPYFWAYTLWTTCGIGFVFLAVRVLDLPPLWGGLIVLSPAGLWNILAGQNGFFISSILIIATTLTYRNAALRAGLAWAVLTIKPHLGLCVLPLLLFKKRWAVIVWGGGILLVLLSLSLWLYGSGAWENFLTFTSRQQVLVVEQWGGLVLTMIPSGFMQGRLLGFDASTAYMLHGVIAAFGAILLYARWPKHDAPLVDWLMWLVLGTLVLLPYSFTYDMVMLQCALALWFVRGPLPQSYLVAMLLWGLPWFGFILADLTKIQVTPWVLLWMLWRTPWRI